MAADKTSGGGAPFWRVHVWLPQLLLLFTKLGDDLEAQCYMINADVTRTGNRRQFCIQNTRSREHARRMRWPPPRQRRLKELTRRSLCNGRLHPSRDPLHE